MFIYSYITENELELLHYLIVKRSSHLVWPQI
jgi:hypothetical protein